MNMAVVPSTYPPRLEAPRARMPLALAVMMWLAWLAVTAVADLLGFLMFAFADSPGSARSAQLMIGPVFVWFGVTFVAGAVLLVLQRWWQILLAFALAISPPFVVFAGYNVLAGGPRVANVNTATTPNPPARPVAVPRGGFTPAFTPPREQPDLRAIISAATSRPTTRPDEDARDDADPR